MAKYLDSAGVKYLWQKIRKADDLTLTSIENIYQKKVSASGNVNRPLYVNSEGEFTVCNVFAGGTEVTLNDVNKGSAVASFYAPTSAGANGQVLTSTGGEPSWVSPSTLHVSYADSCDEATWASSADEADSATNDSDGNNIANTYIKKSLIGTKNGIVPLDATGKIQIGYLPSYVDDVINGVYVSPTVFNNTSGTALSGEAGKIYVDINTNKTYRWSGSQFVEISASLALGETSSTAYAGDKGAANAAAIAAIIDGSQYVQNAIDADSAMYASEAGDSAQLGGVVASSYVTLTGSQALTNKTYNGYTLAAACAKGVTDSTSADAISTSTNLVTERDVYYGLASINGARQTSSVGIYAPTSAGTKNYVLLSNGSGAPKWDTGSSLMVGQAIKDGDGNNIVDTYLPKSGGTISGDLSVSDELSTSNLVADDIEVSGGSLTISGVSASAISSVGGTLATEDWVTGKGYVTTNVIKISLAADSGTLSSTNLAALIARPQHVVFERSGFYYFAENLSSDTTWYYSCNVYYSGSQIIKRVISITKSSGAYSKTDYTYTPPSYTLPTATDKVLGGIKIGYTAGTVAGSSMQRPVQLNTDNKAYVEISRQNIVDVVGEASDKVRGLMSATDKKNLDTIVNSFNSDDADTTIETVQEVLNVFQSYPAGTSLANALAAKLDKTSVNGTSGYIPKFSGTNTIGNSVISQAASNKTTIGGKLVVNAGADTSSGNCDEGIRVLPASGWAELFLSDNSNITGAGGWLVARRGSNGTTSGTAGDFTIEYGGWQGNGLTLYANGNRPRWKNNELAYKSEIPTNYISSSGGTINGLLNVNEYLWAEEIYAGGNDAVSLGSLGIYTSKPIESEAVIKVSGTQMDDTGFHTSEYVDAGWVNATQKVTIGTNKEVSMQYDSSRKALKFVF